MKLIEWKWLNEIDKMKFISCQVIEIMKKIFEIFCKESNLNLYSDNKVSFYKESNLNLYSGNKMYLYKESNLR